MSKMDTSIDHIGIVGRDLSQLEVWYGQVGFRVAPRCELVSLSDRDQPQPMNQHNSHLVFSRTYVELTAVTGQLAGHHLEQSLRRYYGLHILVMLSDDAERDHANLLDAGFHPTQPGLAGRTIDYPSASGMGRFRWFRIPEDEAPESYLCFVEHLTPELVFDPALTDHPNGATELIGLSICVDDPEHSAERLTLAGGGTVHEVPNGIVVKFGHGEIHLMNSRQVQDRFGDLEMPASPFAAAFSLSVADLSIPVGYLEKAGIKHTCEGNRTWVLPPEPFQPVVEFVEIR
ncbi:MAG: VOC family protein [Rhizobiaceae bacterium]